MRDWNWEGVRASGVAGSAALVMLFAVGCEGSGIISPMSEGGEQSTQTAPISSGGIQDTGTVAAATNELPGPPDGGAGDSLGSNVLDTGPELPPGCTTHAECSERLVEWLDACHEARCELSTGECETIPKSNFEPCDDGSACTTNDGCLNGSCTGTTVLCDDGNPCTSDICDPEQGCLLTQHTDPCDDGDPCTGNDTCIAGICTGFPTAACYTGDCCLSHDGPGCSDLTMAACICQVRPDCCVTGWTEECVALAESGQCGECPVPACGDGWCNGDETCSDCPRDCGYCPGCGDGLCLVGESCFNCPLDCGACAGSICGDGQCESGESCTNCATDCGACQGGPDCGDEVCQPTESCFSCPGDCGDCTGPCCGPHDSPGCDDYEVAACVCAADPYCCDHDWDSKCAQKTTFLACSSCEDFEGCGDGTCASDEDCDSCEADCGVCGQATCGNNQCEDSETCGDCPEDCGACCGNGMCSGGETCESCPADCGSCGPAVGNCCEGNGTPGCSVPEIDACVCALDSYCCTSSWDATCASEVELFECASCSGSTGSGYCGDGTCGSSESCTSCAADCGACGGNTGGDCCFDNGTPGCGNASVQSCVCGADNWCCSNEWDSLCADAAINTCGAVCN